MKDASHLIVDRDGSFIALREYLDTKTDIEPVVLPPKSPNLKSECLDKMIFFNERQLRKALKIYVEHYHIERNHQGLKNQPIVPGEEFERENGVIKCRERLGGMLKYYYRNAA